MKTKTIAVLTLFALAQPALANVDIQFDYTYAGDYFTGANAGRQATLNAAASAFETRLTDTLGAIDSIGSGNRFDISFLNPSAPAGGTSETINNQSFAANVIRVYVGGYDTNDTTLGYGGPGGYNCSGSTCAAANRGQGSTASDFGPWGGAISFNFASSINWNYSASSGPASSQYDLYSVAVHELGHVLGFGTADSFDAHVANGQFSGSASGTVNLAPDGAHWADGTMSVANGIAQEAAMTPYLGSGERKYFTDLDFAALKDIGWQVSSVPETDTWSMFLAGLCLIGIVIRRHSR